MVAVGEAAWVPEPDAYPSPDLFDEATARVAEGDTDAIGERLGYARELVRERELRTWSGSFSASRGSERVASSTGIDAESSATATGWSVTLNGELGDGRRGRLSETDEEYRARLVRLAERVGRLDTEASPRPGSVGPVLLHPRVVESYVLRTLLYNLSGGRVADGESHFRREQFGGPEAVLRDDIELRVDPTRPLGLGSYRFTAEGVAARRCTLIEAGRLVHPVVGLKYARRLGLRPTPGPAARDATTFAGGASISEGDAFREANGGVWVLSVLGIHTQDLSSGDFSLSAPQALSLEDGALGGRLRGTVSGNLFSILRDDATRFVAFEGEPTPGLLVRCRFDPRDSAPSPPA